MQNQPDPGAKPMLQNFQAPSRHRPNLLHRTHVCTGVCSHGTLRVFNRDPNLAHFLGKKSERGRMYIIPLSTLISPLNPGIFSLSRTAGERQANRLPLGLVPWPSFRNELPELDFSMGTVMGFQCTFGSRWYWNVGLGPAASYQDTSSG